MRRESSPSIEKVLKEGEITLKSKGIPLLQAKAMMRLPLYCTALGQNAKDLSDTELFQLFKKAVSLVLDEIYEQVMAEEAQASVNIDQLAPVLRDAFAINQPLTALNIMRFFCT